MYQCPYVPQQPLLASRSSERGETLERSSSWQPLTAYKSPRMPHIMCDMREFDQLDRSLEICDTLTFGTLNHPHTLLCLTPNFISMEENRVQMTAESWPKQLC